MDYDYLIIGGGMAADGAVRGIRAFDASKRIGILSRESYPPYDRPPLSKGLWTGKPLESIWKKTSEENISLHLEKEAVKIDPENKRVTDKDGTVYTYDKLLLATGGTPKKLPCPEQEVLYFRSLEDYYRLRALYDRGNDFIVVGSGFIGTEIAAALTMNGKNVTMVFPSSSIGAKSYPIGFSRFLNAYFTEQGVQLLPNETPASITKKGSKYQLTTQNGKVVQADGIIAGIGISPNTELAEKCGLRVNDGITVNSFLQTSNPDIYAAGDAANFYNPLLEKRIRMEHENCAVTMGRCAGQNMAGHAEQYTYLPYFYSDLFELGYEAIGELSSDMEIVEDWHELYRKGIIYYLKEGRIRGAMLLGIWEHIDAIRELIASKEQFTEEKLTGLIVP